MKKNYKQEVLDLITSCGGIDGGHHKQWVLDQIVRILTDCPLVKETAKDCNDKVYEYVTLGESAKYKKFVKDYEAGEDGPNTYSYDIGIPP